jgi:excisionase family DNA binding protein
MLSKVQAAYELGLSERSIDRRVALGVIPAFRRGRRVLFRQEDVERAKAGQKPVRIPPTGRGVVVRQERQAAQ